MRTPFLLACSLMVSQSFGSAIAAEDVDFFESRIRPVLIQHCYECHCTDTEASGGLFLDSREGLLVGGDSGAALVPGKSAESLLIRAIGYTDPNLQMPPDGKLPEDVLADFQRWIDHGAVDPRKGSPAKPMTTTPLGVKDAQQHWAYRPLPSPESFEIGFDLPPGRAVDFWIDRELEKHGWSAVGRAADGALVRRLYFDLTGLPPTPEQLHDALNDRSEDRYERWVENLLASPHFGETIARRWMDVVRYADSITLRGFILPQAWRYRDYLIHSFNHDRSFQTMIREQIAGDLMASDHVDERSGQLVATTFLALGNTNLEEQDKTQLDMDYLDEQLDVLGSAFLGQSIGCARCHDHKFDPIPTRDYYALAGILRSAVAMEHENVSKWIELPLPLDEAEESRFAALENEKLAIEKEIKQLNEILKESGLDKNQRISIDRLPGVVLDNTQARLVGTWIPSTHTKPYVGDGYIHDDNVDKGQKSATFEPQSLPPGEYEVRLAYQPGENRTSRLVAKVFSADGDTEVEINQRKKPDDGVWVSLGKYRFEQDGQAYVLISNADTNGHVILDAVQFLSTRSAPAEESQPSSSATADIASQVKQLEKRLAETRAALGRRPKYLTVRETGQAADIPIHIRGSVHNLGEVVPRGFLSAVIDRTPLQHDSRWEPTRLDLADWVADDSNPLTARVYANRVWLWMMGRGIVDSPNNLGTTGEHPSHPQLLDWLALRLIQSGWSTKALIREIVLSQTYQRAIAAGDEQANLQDPDNTTYWRSPLRRISVESMRDTMLMVSGELDATVGGSLINAKAQTDYNYSHEASRRSIYQPVFRNSLPELFEAFDFADSSVPVGKRGRSTVAPQGLSLMNDPWVAERAEKAAERWMERSVDIGLTAAIQELMEACFGRLPSREELDLSIQFVQADGVSTDLSRSQMEHLIQSLFASIDFRFLE